MKFEIRDYYDEDGTKRGFIWCLISHSGHVMAQPPRPHKSRALVRKAIKTIGEWAPKARVIDTTQVGAAEAA